jgi:hypothetical protein
LLDDAGAIQAQYKYTAFGEVAGVSLDHSGTWSAEDWPLDLSSNMLAGGKKQYYLDFETAMYLLGSGNNGRYCDAAAGRFVSEDLPGARPVEKKPPKNPSQRILPTGSSFNPMDHPPKQSA